MHKNGVNVNKCSTLHLNPTYITSHTWTFNTTRVNLEMRGVTALLSQDKTQPRLTKMVTTGML